MSKNGSGDSSKSPVSKTGTNKNPLTPGVIPVPANSNDSADLDPKLQEMLANLPTPGDVHSTDLYIMNPMLSLPEIGQQMQNGIMAHELLVYECAVARLAHVPEVVKKMAEKFIAEVREILASMVQQFSTEMRMPQTNYWLYGIRKALKPPQQVDHALSFMESYDPHIAAAHLFIRQITAQQPAYRPHLLIEIQRVGRPPTANPTGSGPFHGATERVVQLYVFWDKEEDSVEKDVLTRIKQAQELSTPSPTSPTKKEEEKSVA